MCQKLNSFKAARNHTLKAPLINVKFCLQTEKEKHINLNFLLNLISFNLDFLKVLYHFLKETVSVPSSDSPSKDGNARYSTVHLKALSDQV